MHVLMHNMLPLLHSYLNSCISSYVNTCALTTQHGDGRAAGLTAVSSPASREAVSVSTSGAADYDMVLST